MARQNAEKSDFSRRRRRCRTTFSHIYISFRIVVSRVLLLYIIMHVSCNKGD